MFFLKLVASGPLKESDTRFSTSGFFHESVSPRPPSIPLEPFWIFSKIRGDIRELMFINDTGDKVFSGVNDTSEKFIAGVINLCHGFSVIAGVVDTGEQFIAGDNDSGDKFIAGDNDTGEKLSPVTCRWQEQGRHGGGELPRIGESWRG